MNAQSVTAAPLSADDPIRRVTVGGTTLGIHERILRKLGYDPDGIAPNELHRVIIASLKVRWMGGMSVDAEPAFSYWIRLEDAWIDAMHQELER